MKDERRRKGSTLEDDKRRKAPLPLSHLGGKPLLDVGLEPAQQEGPQELVELRDDLRLVLLADLEPLLELLGRAEDLGEEEVEEGPEFLEVVLEWRARDEHPVVGAHEADDLGEPRVGVLDAVGLVDDDVAPVEPAEVPLLADDHLVGSDAHVKRARRHEHVLHRLALLLAPVELRGGGGAQKRQGSRQERGAREEAGAVKGGGR